MKSRTTAPLALSFALVASLTACAQAPQPAPAAVATTEQAAASDVVATQVTADAGTSPAAVGALPLVVVHKSATCGCCNLWVDHMREAGFQVEVRDVDNVNTIKERVGVPLGKGSCHTAEVDGYFVEGHVPAEDVKRLLAEKPDAKGLVVPGMPAGSPGMEVPDGTIQPYTVELVGQDGGTTAFAQHGQ
ncbi:MAG TPA: DUF411 domain-containing protein [Lysobacter sp.]|nr:DUF411 domain-containing protein [Lysobacter sp.]